MKESNKIRSRSRAQGNLTIIMIQRDKDIPPNIIARGYSAIGGENICLVGNEGQRNIEGKD